VAETLSYRTDAQCEALFGEDKEAAAAFRDIQAFLAGNEPAQALTTCERMLSERPGNRIFEGLKLEIENKAHEIRLDSIWRLSSELEKRPGLDARIEAIQQTLDRYPSDPGLAELLKNATARRDFFNVLITEARAEESSEKYAEALERWHLIRELWPTLPLVGIEMRRLEALAEEKRRLKLRGEFVDAISQLSSTGDYTRAAYQCINALSVFPNDDGFLALRQNVEEKAAHATELQRFVTEGLTFLQGRAAEAALEAFAKARNLDPTNLQVRYLIGIALLEKARTVMNEDRRRLNVLLDEAKSLIPNQPEVQTLGTSDESSDEVWERSLVRIEYPSAGVERNIAPPETVSAGPVVPEPFPVHKTAAADPTPPESRRHFRPIALAGLGILIAGFSGLAYIDRAGSDKHSPVATQAATLDTQPASTVPSPSVPVPVDLKPALLDIHIVSDQAVGTVWIDDQMKGAIVEGGLQISGVEPGVRTVRIRRPAGEIEVRFDASGQMPRPTLLPSRQLATVLFAGSADGKTRVECNCAPAGLRIGNLAELIRAAGLEIPLADGQHAAELWLGKTYKKLSIQGSGSPSVTIVVLSNATAKEPS